MFTRDNPLAFYHACHDHEGAVFQDLPNDRSRASFQVGSIRVVMDYFSGTMDEATMNIGAHIGDSLVAEVEAKIGTSTWLVFPNDVNNLLLFMALA